MTEQAATMEQQDQPLWTPDEQTVENAQISRFMNETGKNFTGYSELWRWSVDSPEEFWSLVWDFCGVIGDKGDDVLKNGDTMTGAQFFPRARLNYAENVLRRRDDETAVIFRAENGEEQSLKFSKLYSEVSRFAQALKETGIGKGDRVAGYMPNIPATIIAMLATASLGAIWSSASPDFGVQGVLDRFGQIEPKLLVAADGYFYNGKTIDCLERIKAVQTQLPGLEKTVIVPFAGQMPDLAFGYKNTVTLLDFMAPFTPRDINFERVAFAHPLFIMYSSGTTGEPKCIVHGHGGTLLQHLKEHRLHCDIKRGDRVFYFTTCGWMMWNWLVTALAGEAALLLYDGSPFYPDGEVLWEFTDKHECTLFGTAAKYIDALKNGGIRPKDKFDLGAMRTITSTGSPLVHESFDYVYDAVKRDVHLASISGGTDIISCFMLGNPLSPVWRGEIQGPGLGMAVEVFDENGSPVQAGSGELVCARPFPSMPVMFWNDPDGKKYHDAYFERYPNVWRHGDWVERTPHDGFIIYGRSDATLNPGGVRIGTSEIYRQVEQFEEVAESIAVGQDWENDVRVVLFIVLKDGAELSDELRDGIKKAIRAGASPRHVPAKIIQIADIPRTKSGKITEIAVRDVIHGRLVKNREALANPKALELYRSIEELQT